MTSKKTYIQKVKNDFKSKAINLNKLSDLLSLKLLRL